MLRCKGLAGTLLGIQLILFGFVETKRWVDFSKPGSQAEEGSFFGLEGAFNQGKGNGYPGGPFDPLTTPSESSIHSDGLPGVC